MNITVLLENTTCREDLKAEHGLSLYLEVGSRKVLFDAGQTGLYSENAETLGIDLTKVDTAILSHGHYDHGGGLLRFLDLNKTAPIYASPLCFGEFYNGQDKYIGLSPLLRDSLRVKPVYDPTDLGDGLKLYPGHRVPTPRKIQNFGLTEKALQNFMPDCFLHEQYLMVEENGKRILFSGCSHRGILNIAEYFQPDILVGGFHFKKLDPVEDRETLEASARELLQYPTTYYTCHCTGKEQYQVMKEIMGDRLHYLATGAQVTL